MAKGKQEFDLVPLLLKVKENPILYDTDQEDYGDPIKTNRAWNGIARELLLPNGEVVRCKWKSTCELYLKSLKGNKKNATVKWPWAEHMKYFEPYLTNAKTPSEQNKDGATTPSTPNKSVPQKRQRSPVEVAASHRFSRSLASVEEELGETDSPVKKARMSVLEETVESKITKRTPRKSETPKASSKRLPRSALRAQESQVSVNEEEPGSSTSSEKITMKSSNKTTNVSPSKALPKGISPEMKKGPRRLPRSVLRALEAEAENHSGISEHSQQASSSASTSAAQAVEADTSLLDQTIEALPSLKISSRTTKRSQRFSLDPNLSSVRSPLRPTRYSTIPEELPSKDDLLENPVSSARFSTSRMITTGSTPSSFRESLGYFESVTKEPKKSDIEIMSENRSIFQSPVRNSVSSLTSNSRRLPRSSALEEEFARHDAMMENSAILNTSEHDSSFNDRNCSKRVSITPGTKENMDATDLLFLSHALTIKSFSERKQLEVKRKIAQIIAQAEIDEMA